MILSYKEWAEDAKDTMHPDFLDRATAKHLEPLLSGYVNSPIAITEKGETIEAKGVTFKSIDDIYDHFEKEVKSGCRVYLYKIMFRPSLPFITKLDPATFDEVLLPRPIMSEAVWQVRYAAI